MAKKSKQKGLTKAATPSAPEPAEEWNDELEESEEWNDEDAEAKATAEVSKTEPIDLAKTIPSGVPLSKIPGKLRKLL